MRGATYEAHVVCAVAGALELREELHVGVARALRLVGNPRRPLRPRRGGERKCGVLQLAEEQEREVLARGVRLARVPRVGEHVGHHDVAAGHGARHGAQEGVDVCVAGRAAVRVPAGRRRGRVQVQQRARDERDARDERAAAAEPLQRDVGVRARRLGLRRRHAELEARLGHGAFGRARGAQKNFWAPCVAAAPQP